MSELTVCGADCASCELKDKCTGCSASQGHPFFLGENQCDVFVCANSKRIRNCGGCSAESCSTFRSVVPDGVKDNDLYIRQKAYNLKEMNRRIQAGLGIRFGEYRVEKAPAKK